jgi:Protein of unknown function (DUF3105)
MADTRKTKPKPGSSGKKPQGRGSGTGAGTAAKARPRPEKGKLAKGAAARRLAEKKRRQRTILWSGVAVVTLVALVALIVFQGRDEPSASAGNPPVDAATLAAAREAAGSQGLKTFPSAGRDHIGDGEQASNWNSNPPTSGDHLGSPRSPGVYDSEQDPRALVHNLEHGYVVILYKGIPQDQIDQLRGFVEEREGSKLVLSPYSGLAENGVALAAWQNHEIMQRANLDVVQAFVNDYMVPIATKSTAPEPGAA